MAERKDDSDLDDIPVSVEELQQALSLLAGSDPENCSYPEGYVKRQAVFACNTCTPSPAEPAGICLACANKCHDGHNIFELYTKRNFRCDCGNRKFQGFQCQLIPAKDEENSKNHYDHNFNGCYCICDRPYPDTDEQGRETGGEMIQCVVCEDWFHSKHLGCSIVEPDELQEMVCEACMNKAPFLWTYAAKFAVPPVVSQSEEEEEVVEVDVEGGGQKEEGSEPLQNENEEPTSSHEEKTTEISPTCKRTHEEMTGRPRKTKIKTASCKLKELQAQGLRRLKQGAVFWPYGWRSELCTCTSCKRAYVAAEVQFLMDQSDTMLAYENRGLDQPFGQHLLMALTSSMDHVQQLEVIYGIEELTTSITAFLGQHAAEGRTVTVEAVREFFAELQARKRRRTSTGYE